MTAEKTAREAYFMKKSKILVVALIGLLVGGLVLAGLGCDDGGSGGSTGIEPWCTECNRQQKKCDSGCKHGKYCECR